MAPREVAHVVPHPASRLRRVDDSITPDATLEGKIRDKGLTRRGVRLGRGIYCEKIETAQIIP